MTEGAPTRQQVGAVYETHFSEDRRRERRLISAISFFGTFALVRGATHAIRATGRNFFKELLRR